MKYSLGLNKTLVRLKLICRKWMVFVSLWEHRRDSVRVSISDSANINVQVSKIQSLLLLSDEGWKGMWRYVIQNYYLTWKSTGCRTHSENLVKMYSGCSLVAEETALYAGGCRDAANPDRSTKVCGSCLDSAPLKNQSKMWFTEWLFCFMLCVFHYCFCKRRQPDRSRSLEDREKESVLW